MSGPSNSKAMLVSNVQRSDSNSDSENETFNLDCRSNQENFNKWQNESQPASNKTISEEPTASDVHVQI